MSLLMSFLFNSWEIWINVDKTVSTQGPLCYNIALSLAKVSFMQNLQDNDIVLPCISVFCINAKFSSNWNKYLALGYFCPRWPFHENLMPTCGCVFLTTCPRFLQPVAAVCSLIPVGAVGTGTMWPSSQQAQPISPIYSAVKLQIHTLIHSESRRLKEERRSAFHSPSWI